MLDSNAIQFAADRIADAKAILVAAGAGIGVDSGLPDFRGADGFWRAYPPYRGLGLRFTDLANPMSFHANPKLAWGFYGHRLNLYRATKPHEGFQILLKWAAQKSCGHFVFTSNVDGQIQRAGFDADRVVECHGSINHLQCLSGCHEGIWPVDQHVDVDSNSMTAIGAMPACRKCGGLARPNILMFGDGSWLESRTAGQMHRYDQWLGKVNVDEMAIIEIGAGNAIPTVRFNSERLASKGATLIRINPDDPQGPRGTIQLRTSALEALSRIDARLHLD